jgi:hypothetical protein
MYLLITNGGLRTRLKKMYVLRGIANVELFCFDNKLNILLNVKQRVGIGK